MGYRTWPWRDDLTKKESQSIDETPSYIRLCDPQALVCTMNDIDNEVIRNRRVDARTVGECCIGLKFPCQRVQVSLL